MQLYYQRRYVLIRLDDFIHSLFCECCSSYRAYSMPLSQARVEEMEKQDKERKDREDEIALEKIAQAYKGRPLPEEW
jgi:hypothetical protein